MMIAIFAAMWLVVMLAQSFLCELPVLQEAHRLLQEVEGNE